MDEGNDVSGDVTHVFDRAARWSESLRRGEVDRRKLFAWLAESPRHPEELLFANTLMDLIADLDSQQWEEIRVMALTRQPHEERSSNVVVLGNFDTPPPVDPSHWSAIWDRMRRKVHWIAAGLAALALTLGWSALHLRESQIYSTAVGEQRTLELEDGSLVNLNTRSRIRVYFTAHERLIHLIEGEALFKVAHEASRPFRVQADNAMIQAVGTQFDVYRHSQGATVSVIEGQVRISTNEATARNAVKEPLAATKASRETPPHYAPLAAVALTAGEEVQIAASGSVTRREPADLAKTLAWQQRRLVFHGDTLADVATEFNRYNRSRQIRVEGNAASQKFAGVFDADAPDSLVRAISADDTLIVERLGDEIVIRAR